MREEPGELAGRQEYRAVMRRSSLTQARNLAEPEIDKNHPKGETA
jgi:hypothetical protein